jgi:hypothetical protein
MISMFSVVVKQNRECIVTDICSLASRQKSSTFNEGPERTPFA